MDDPPSTTQGERIRAWWIFLLGRVGAALLLSVGLVLVASAGMVLRWLVNPSEGDLETIVFTEPAPLLHTWYPIVLVHSLLVVLLPRGPWSPLVVCAAALFTVLVWVGPEAPNPIATPGAPDGDAAVLAGALFGWDTPPLQHPPGVAGVARTILGVLLVCAAVMVARDFRRPRSRPRSSRGGRSRLRRPAGVLCALVAVCVAAWVVLLAFVAVTGGTAVLDGALSPITALFTPVPTEGRWQELLFGLVFVLFPVGYAAVHAARSLLNVSVRDPGR